MDLQKIIEKNKHKLGVNEKKFNPLWNRIKNRGYTPSEKTYRKLEQFATLEIIDFLFECIKEYNQTERIWSVHHDNHTLQIIWYVFAFYNDKKVDDYFEQIIDDNINNKNLFLTTLLAIFEEVNNKLPFVQKIQHYYDTEVNPNLASTKLVNKLKLDVPEEFYFSFKISTDGEWIYSTFDTEEERKNRYCIEVVVYGKNPTTYNQSYSIEFHNGADDYEDRKDVRFKDGQYIENEYYNYGFDDNKLITPDLLNLGQFVDEIETLLNIKFDFENIADVSTVRGVKRKTITDWIKRKFEFNE